MLVSLVSVAAAENPPVTGTPPEGVRFEPGKSGNPGGRPKGLAKRVREEVGDEGELVKLMLCIAYDLKNESTRDRMDAVKWLSDRGWGKAPAFAPVEDDDPLELSDARATEVAAELDKRLDDLAAARAAREAAREAAAT